MAAVTLFATKIKAGPTIAAYPQQASLFGLSKFFPLEGSLNRTPEQLGSPEAWVGQVGLFLGPHFAFYPCGTAAHYCPAAKLLPPIRPHTTGGHTALREAQYAHLWLFSKSHFKYLHKYLLCSHGNWDRMSIHPLFPAKFLSLQIRFKYLHLCAGNDQLTKKMTQKLTRLLHDLCWKSKMLKNEE